MIVTRTPESIVHDVLDDRPETKALSWGDKVDLSARIVEQLRTQGECLHREDCDTWGTTCD